MNSLAVNSSVSNPLRLEGNTFVVSILPPQRWFLIHYGWRGTRSRLRRLPATGLFLIHYGWRGTCFVWVRLLFSPLVSNPLRLEGNCPNMPICNKVRWFLIHYGWRGTIEISNQDWRNFVFLIHYGWRGTRFGAILI